ncbi:cilia- and flagella-associated protein 54 [Polymixia lowei]
MLDFIRIMMQAFQQHEHLCWHLYNGSLHIYNICRYLMTKNCSAQVLEYLLWASISLELPIPLMTAKYLPWRATLYCAVCQCYYDNQAAVQAEVFARRALGKISDLAKLEEQSEIPVTTETQRAYKEATIKMAAMLFKRAVYEPRRKPKGLFRTKPKSNVKEIPNVSWPRSTTERVLMELFDSNAAQFLGILEALWDSTRRPLQTGMPDEPELQEVVVELLSAGISLLSGVGSASEQGNDGSLPMCLSALTPSSTLIELAITGVNKVSFMSAVRFIKFLFHYEQWNVFTQLAREMLKVLPIVEDQSFRKAELELALLDSFCSLQSSQKLRPRDDNMTNERDKPGILLSDEFVGLVNTLHKSVCGSSSDVQPDRDLVLDVVLFLWCRIKGVFQRSQLQHWGSKHHLGKHHHKWMWCLSTMCEVAFVCDLATVDCIVMAEMTLRLAMLLEGAADSINEEDGVKPRPFSPLKKSSAELLQRLCEVVEGGLKGLARGWAALLPRDSSAIGDSTFLQKCKRLPPSTPSPPPSTSSEEGLGEDGKGVSKNQEEGQEAEAEAEVKSSSPTPSCPLSLVATDLHLELVMIYHRASLKLLQLNPVFSETDLLDRIKKNKVSKALFLSQKALLVHNMEPNNSYKTKSLLEEAFALIEKAGVEEKKLYKSNTSPAETSPSENKDSRTEEERDRPPPPPVLLSSTNHSLTFAPARYHMEEQVCWYQICGRAAEGVNLKVRLGDCSLPGTGNLVPAVPGQCELRVEGLETNQKYVFAVAAYNSQGKLVGNTIGETTRPVLASMPLPLLTTWALLAQVAFNMEHYAAAKRACRELWSRYTSPSAGPHSTKDSLALTGLHVQTLQRSSPLLLQMFLTSIFIETEINIQEGALYCDSLCDSGPPICGQEARLAECERMLVAMDLAMRLNDSSIALQAVVGCYGLLAPLIFHQITCDPVVQVLIKCLVILEDNSSVLKQKRTGETSESLMHMIACITYYLSKTLRVLREHRMASLVMDQGRRLLKDVYEAQPVVSRLASAAERSKKAAGEDKMKISVQMKALYWKNKKGNPGEAEVTAGTPHPHDLTGKEDPDIVYNLIAHNTLKNSYLDVMKFRHKACFVEFAALLLQRTMEEDQPDQVIQWGQDIFACICRRDKSLGLSGKCLEGKRHKKKRTAQGVKEYDPSKTKKTSCSEQKKKLSKKQVRILQEERTDREMQAVETVLMLMSSLMRCHKQRLQLRHICSEERVWRSHLNHIIAQAHLAVLHKGLDQLHGPALQHSYSQFNPLSFSLAHSGVLLPRKNPPPLPPQPPEPGNHRNSPLCSVRDYLLPVRKDKEEEEAVSGADLVTVESCEEGEDPPQTATADKTDTKAPSVTSMTRSTTAPLLHSLNNAALHLRRAMVLAHRGGHWTTLQCVCRTLWDQGCRTAALLDRVARQQLPSPITVDQLHTILTPLLVLATDLLMDMLDRLGLWRVYDSDVSDEELEASLCSPGPLDDGTKVDLRWIRTLVLHTLELLHVRARWETLAHFALLFNSYTRERYTLMVSPLLVYAQRRLLDRIASVGGPPVPQPHHVKTQKATGKELLSGWTPPRKASPKLNNSSPRPMPTHDNPQWMNPTCPDTIELQEMRRSMSLVRVPLDVEETLHRYRGALEGRPHCLHTFQHSCSLLLLLLAHTQLSAEVQVRPSGGAVHFSDQVEICPIVTTAPHLQPRDLTEEDYSTLNALYCLPVSPRHIHTVITAYSTSIKSLQANGHSFLQVQALHDMGNLQFYNGNTRAAHSFWCKALDCALLSSGVLEKWDGVSWGGGSPRHTLKLSGIWGCLQAAVLAAKIAQYILTSDINHRTMCCLLSAHLFKCVLCCSLPQPQCDVQFASHIVGDELLPGVDLFSEPHRVHLGTTITSLNFLCYWLYSTGHYTTMLPMLALYLHFVGTVCRDVQRTVEGKILKMRALTELSLFTQAVNEADQLTQGKGVILPHGHNISIDKPQAVRKFYNNRPLLDNAQALEDLVNCSPAPEVCRLYGPMLCRRFNLARVQLVLALGSTIQALPLSEAPDGETHTNVKDHSLLQDQDNPDTEASSLKRKEPKGLVLDPQKESISPEKMKFVLLEGVFSLLNTSCQPHQAQSHSRAEELELNIETNLLMANLYLQQGRAALSSDMSVASLMLLQTSPVIMEGSSTSQTHASNLLPHARPGSQQCGSDSHSVSSPLPADCPRTAEARQRIGAALWLRCRLALVRSLAAHIPGTAILPGKDSNEEAARVLKEGLEECALWGDPDTRALLLLEGAALDTHRGQSKDDRMSALQEAVSLLSGRTCMPPGSSLTLARATLFLSDLRGTHSTTLLELTQKLLQQQLGVFDQSVVLENGKVCLPPAELSNIYLPHLPLLAKTTMRIGHVLALKATERSISTSEFVSRQSSPSDLTTPGPTESPACSFFQIPPVSPGPDAVQAWRDAHEMLLSALSLSQSCAYRDTELQGDLLYWRGNKEEPMTLAFILCFLFPSIVIHPCLAPQLIQISHWKRLLARVNTRLSTAEGLLLPFWVCLRAAAMVLEAMSGRGQLRGSIGAEGGALSDVALEALPDFAINDLLQPCGGVSQLSRHPASQAPEAVHSFRDVSRKRSQLTWAHLARYYTHLLNLQQVATKPVCPQTAEGLASLAGDVSLAPRLSRLHSFFCSHMTSYRENCCPPEPAPTELRPTVGARLGQVDEAYQWSVSTKQQLCMQWYQPSLSPAPEYQDIVLLLYSHNRHPMYAMKGSASAIMGLQCGQHIIRIERARAVHAELCDMYVLANTTLSVTADLFCTPSHKAQQLNETPGKPLNQHMPILKEKILSCCLSIKDLLRPGSKSDPLPEVPFDITLENLCDLESCFNPAGGAIVDRSALTDWILSVITTSCPPIV